MQVKGRLPRLLQGNWRNPAGRRPQDGEPVQVPVGGGAAVVASGCWQTGTKRDKKSFLSEGTCLGCGEPPHPCPENPGAHYCWKQWRA